MKWYWEGMRRQITQYVRQCAICQQQKASYQTPAGLLQPLPISTCVWENITMDLWKAFQNPTALTRYWW